MADQSTTALERALCGYAARVGAGDILAAPMPWVAQRLVDDLGDGELGPDRVIECISADPLLALAILRAANRLEPHQGATITLPAAVRALGRRETLRTLFGAGAGVKKKSIETPLSSLRRLVWRRSIMTATLCRTMAPHFGVDPEAAYVCGLLRDIGVLVGLSCLENPLQHSPFEERLSARQCAELCVRSRKAVAGQLLADSSLPRDIVLSACGGETSSSSPPPLVKLATAASYAVAQREASVVMGTDFACDIPFVDEDEQRLALGRALRGLSCTAMHLEREPDLRVHAGDDPSFVMEYEFLPVVGVLSLVSGVAEVPVHDGRISYTAMRGVLPTPVSQGALTTLRLLDDEAAWELLMCVTSCAQVTVDNDRYRVALEPIVLHEFDQECWLRAVGKAIVHAHRRPGVADNGVFDPVDGRFPLCETDFLAVGTNVGSRRPVAPNDDEVDLESIEFVWETTPSPDIGLGSLAWVAMPLADLDD